MIDGHEAPADLTAARRRVRSTVDAYRRNLDPGPTGPAATVVVLDGERFDDRQRAALGTATAAVTTDLVLWRWDDDNLAELARRLPAGAVLVFLEPTADLGWRRLVHRLGRKPIRHLLGHDFESDLPARLRAAGLLVTTVDRFGLGPLGLWTYAWGRADHRPAEPAPDPPPGQGSGTDPEDGGQGQVSSR